MWETAKGALLSLFVNVLTIVGWWFVGMWLPSLANVVIALLVLGLWGLEDEWAFPLGYWAVELLFIIIWIAGMGWAMGGGVSA